MQLTGIHHLTAVTADAPGNRSFYSDKLGLRLVKKTVNQDDTSAYHLFYADGEATPGTDLTFFDWPVGREKRGTHAIVRTGLRVEGASSLDWWKENFDAEKISHGELQEIDGRLTLPFEDFDGQRLALVDDGGAGEAHSWAASGVPAAHQVRGLGPITLSVPNLAPTADVLTRVLSMREVRSYKQGTATVHVFEMGEGGVAAELHVVEEPQLPAARQGAGAVHHVAFRTPDVTEYQGWIDRLKSLRIPSSGAVDRYYFRSLYFREPNGILFEIASDGPGFATDEPLEHLGERLALPPFLEKRRAEIEAGLKPL